MKKFVATLVFLSLIVGCVPAVMAGQAKIDTNTPTPGEAISYSSFSCSEPVIGTWWDTQSPSRTIVIKSVAGGYTMTSTYGDGTTETIILGAKVVYGETRLYLDAPKLDGEYLMIKKDGVLAFYNDGGFIYEITP